MQRLKELVKKKRQRHLDDKFRVFVKKDQTMYTLIHMKSIMPQTKTIEWQMKRAEV